MGRTTKGRAPASSPASRALDALLTEGGPEAEKVAARFHRTMLWRFRTGRRMPDIVTASALHALSGGRVAIDGWVPIEPRRCRRCAGARACKAPTAGAA